MNSHGDVVGWCVFAGVIDDPDSEHDGEPIDWMHAFLYTADGVMWDLTELLGADLQEKWPGLGMGIAQDINDAGQILGLTAPLGPGDESFPERVRYTPPSVTGGEPEFIGWDVGQFDAKRLNNWGDVVGNTPQGPALYTDEQGLQLLPLVSDLRWATRAINDFDQVAGYVNGNQALRYTPSDTIVLLNSYSFPNGINNYGEIVGDYRVGTYRRAFWWYRDTDGVERLHDLGTLGGKWSYAFSVNGNADDTKRAVIGSSTTKTGEERPFIYTRATGMVDVLKCLVGTVPAGRIELSRESGVINARGQICGVLSDGITRQTILLNPVE
jgi:hypothetical protein